MAAVLWFGMDWQGTAGSGAAVEITAPALKLNWHREELRRERAVVIDMELIKHGGDGRYVVGRLGPFSNIDDQRDEYLFLGLAHESVVALSALESSCLSFLDRRFGISDREGCLPFHGIFPVEGACRLKGLAQESQPPRLRSQTTLRLRAATDARH